MEQEVEALEVKIRTLIITEFQLEVAIILMTQTLVLEKMIMMKTMKTCLQNLEKIINSRMVQFTKANGEDLRDMVKEYKFGLMVQDMKVSGRKIKLMEGENSGMQTVMFSMENGKMIKLMAMVFILM